MDAATTMSVDDKNSKYDFYALKRLCKKEIVDLGQSGRICGYTKRNLKKFLESPQHHSTELLSVIRFMYSHSGHFRKIIQYYINLVLADCWTIDTEFLTPNIRESNKKRIKQDYFKFLKEVSSYNLSIVVSDILFDVFMYDAYFGYEIDTDEGKVLFGFNPEDCVITGYTNGIPNFAVKKPSGSKGIKAYPEEINFIFGNKKFDFGFDPSYSQMPSEKAFCVKYNKNFSHLYPPFAFIIQEILNLEDFKAIEKIKAKNDASRLVVMNLPSNENGVPTLSLDDAAPFYQLASEVLPESVGIFPTPFKTDPIEFKSNTADNINNVQNAIDEMYSELGVSKALLSGASSGSELKTSIEIDASEVYRILKQIARNINYHCQIRLANNEKYRFSLRFLDITAFNQADKVDKLLKMAQASCPVKMELVAAMGYNPAKMFGGAFMENDVFDLAANWKPMQTSYTQSADGENSENNGRPAMDENDISDITQNTHDNEGNDKDNRV